MNGDEDKQTTRKPALTRQEHLHTLAQFVAALSRAIQQSSPAPEKLKEAVRASISAECVQCHTRVSGEELMELPELAPADASKNKAARLLQGYCVRNGCDSRYYSLTFADHPGVDWPKLLSQIESAPGEETDRVGDELALSPVDRIVRKRRLTVRVCVGIGVLALVLLIRQWYLGGRIPFIREPENFQVDRVPAGQQTPP